MCKVRSSVLAFICAFVAALSAGVAQAAQQPNTCTPPGAWATRTASPSTVVRAWGAFFPTNGKFYAVGGRADDTAGHDLLQPIEYDPLLDTWVTKIATLGDHQVNNMVGGVLNFGGTSFIVVVGGSAAGATTATSEVRQYDPVADVVTTLTSDPWPGNTNGTTLPGGAAVVNNKLYVFGGFNIGVGMVSTIYRFDPAAIAGSRWTLMTATLPVPLGYIPTAASGGMIYMLGGSGYTVTPPAVLDTSGSVRYDPVADTVTSIAAIPRATGETRAVAQPNGTIWVLGGGRVAPNPSNEVDVYAPATDTWTVGPAFATARRNFAADTDPVVGSVWATGGYQAPTTFLSVNEQFTACPVVTDRIFADGFDGP